MNKLWLSQYPAGMPAPVDVTPEASLTHLIDASLQAHAALPAITAGGKATSFAELDVLSSRFAAWLQSRGVAKGDRVALMMPNVLPFAIGVIGVLRTGAVVVTVNPLYTPRELAHQLKDSGAQTIVIFDAFASTLDAVLVQTGIQNIVVIQSGLVLTDSYTLPGHVSFMETMTTGAAMIRQPVEVGLDDVAFLQYTGGTIGFPVPNTEIAIRNDDNQDVPLRERGEICIRGPQVMAGYWQRADEMANVTTADGYFKSGDIGVMDERGYIKIVDRKKDMILVSGFNVFPNEIEEVVAKCTGILELAAIGILDDKTGEAVKVFIVRSDPELTEAQVRAHCRANLTAYKCPKQIVFVEALPKSTVGKILRRELRG